MDIHSDMLQVIHSDMICDFQLSMENGAVSQVTKSRLVSNNWKVEYKSRGINITTVNQLNHLNIFTFATEIVSLITHDNNRLLYNNKGKSSSYENFMNIEFNFINGRDYRTGYLVYKFPNSDRIMFHDLKHFFKSQPINGECSLNFG